MKNKVSWIDQVNTQEIERLFKIDHDKLVNNFLNSDKCKHLKEVYGEKLKELFKVNLKVKIVVLPNKEKAVLVIKNYNAGKEIKTEIYMLSAFEVFRIDQDITNGEPKNATPEQLGRYYLKNLSYVLYNSQFEDWFNYLNKLNEGRTINRLTYKQANDSFYTDLKLANEKDFNKLMNLINKRR